MSHELEAAAELISRAPHASLGTLTPAGAPYVSLVACARVGPRPLLLLSRLAEHTKNLLERPDVSLLYVDGDAADPLAAGRVTLLGRPVLARPRHRRRRKPRAVPRSLPGRAPIRRLR